MEATTQTVRVLTPRSQKSLISAMDMKASREDFRKYSGGNDVHAVLIIVDPWLKNVAWVYNFKYPKGKDDGWGLVGGRGAPNDKDDEETARREGKEETGVEDFVNLGKICEGLVSNGKTGDARREYWRAVFLFVARTPGDPNTQALDENGRAETREFRWIPFGKAPDVDGVDENGNPTKERVYFTHMSTLSEPSVLSAIKQARTYFSDELDRVAQREAWQKVASQHLLQT